jgi:peptidylprolyl isomerase
MWLIHVSLCTHIDATIHDSTGTTYAVLPVDMPASNYPAATTTGGLILVAGIPSLLIALGILFVCGRTDLMETDTTVSTGVLNPRNLYFLLLQTGMPMSSVRLFILAGMLVALLVLSGGCTDQVDKTVKPGSFTGTLTVTPSGTAAGQVPATSTVPVSMESWRRARLETNMGTITIALDPEMPVTAGNFESLVQKGFYDGVIFHRVIDGFMIQGGDPAGTGRGGPGYTITDEYTEHNMNSRGAVAMANTGHPNSGGSQFFINLVDNSPLQDYQFNKNYPVFGNVVEGMDVVDAIGSVQTTGYPTDRPLQNVTIIRAMMI